MVTYIIKRCLLIIPTLLGIALIILLLLNYVPGSDPNSFSSDGGGDARDSFFDTVGMDDGFAARYIRYFYNLIVKHEFGPANKGHSSIGTDLAYRLRYTLLLTGLSFLITFVVGIPLGIYSALKRGKWQDQAVSFLTLTLSSIPSYCLTLFLVIVFSLWLRLLPVSGIRDPGSFVLPTAVLSMGGIALTARMARSAVIEVLDKPYITALRAKGLSERKIIFRHVLKNSLIPVVSTLNNLTAQMLCSTLVVENFFSIPGLGAYLIAAVSVRNQHAILGCVLIISLLLMIFGIVADIMCMIFNPKMRTQYTKASQKPRRDNVEA